MKRTLLVEQETNKQTNKQEREGLTKLVTYHVTDRDERGTDDDRHRRKGPETES